MAGRPRPRAEEERRVETRLANDGDATRHGPEDEARAHEPRVDEKDVGAKLVQHGANEDLGQLAAVKAVVGQTGDQGKAPPPPRRPDDRGERDEVLRQDMARPVRFPGMVEPACGAWCCLRAAQE